VHKGIILVAFLFAGCASAPAQNDSAETLVQHELDEMLAAWNRDDLDAHLKAYADSATWTTPTGLLRGKTAIRATLTRSFLRGSELTGDLSFGKTEFRRLGPDAMMTNGSFHVGNLPNGGKIDGQSTLVWRRYGSQWRIIHDHSS
jgi:uncharacterized protein (TIGR02246 family)